MDSALEQSTTQLSYPRQQPRYDVNIIRTPPHTDRRGVGSGGGRGGGGGGLGDSKSL